MNNGMTGRLEGVAATALAMAEACDFDFELAAGHAVCEAREMMAFDPVEAFKWVRIAALLQGKDVEEVAHA